MLAIKSILHPTDFSPASERARRAACGLAKDYGARLIFLHVVEPPVYYGEVGVNFTVPIGDFEAEHARIGDLAKTITEVNVEPMAVEGVAATEIVRVAREQACDLIVIGSHGRDGLGRVLMGSVAEEVSRHSPCATLIVRATAVFEHPGSAASTTVSA